MLFRSQESLRRNGVALIVKKRIQNAVLGCNLKNNKIISVHFQCKPFYITVNQVYAPSTATKEAEQFFEGLKDLLGLTPKNKSFSSQRTGIQSRKSRDTWSSSQVGPRNPKLSRSKTNRLLPREHTDHSNHPLPTTQEKTLHMDITRWSIPKSD